MRYTIQKGLVLEQICDVSLLIATLEARKYCPYLTQLNEASAYLWNMLMKNMDTEEMIAATAAEYGLTREEASGVIDAFLKELQKNHFIAPDLQEIKGE